MRFVLLSFSLLCLLKLSAQSGCTDPAASNFNNQAVVNDGSCLYPLSSQATQSLAAIQLSVTESSGLKFIDGNLFTLNDSGGAPEIYCIDTITGSVQHIIQVTNFPNNDWEELSADSDFIYVGDFGNNNGTRTDLKILKIDKAQLAGQLGFTRSVTAQAIEFSYADQIDFTSNALSNFDAEAFVSVRDSLYIFSKSKADQNSKIYKLPKTAGTYTVAPYQSFAVNGCITGADYNPISNQVVLIGYSLFANNSFLYYLYDFPGVKFYSGNKRRVQIGNNQTWQTEAVAWYNGSNTNRLFLSCETAGTYSAAVFSSSKNSILTNLLSSKGNDLQLFKIISLNNGDKEIQLLSPLQKIEVMDASGRQRHYELDEAREKITIQSSELVELKILNIQLKSGVQLHLKILN